MKTIRLLFPLLVATGLFGQYQYFLTETYSGYGSVSSNWVSNPYYRILGGLVWNTDLSCCPYYDQPLTYAGSVPATGRYEIRTVMPSPNTYSGTYTHFAAINTPQGLPPGYQGLQSYYRTAYTIFGGNSNTPCTANIG
jgi:hypothetical protein